MPSITLAQVSPTRTSAPPSADGSIEAVGTDAFAALLLGQIPADPRSDQIIDADALLNTQETLDTTASSTPFDPAQFLVSMGISLLPRETASQEMASLDSRHVDLSATDGKIRAALTGDTNALQPEALATEDNLATTLRRGTQTADGSTTAIAAETGNTAKLAGFEQKLADTLKAPIEAGTSSNTVASSAIAAQGQSGNGLSGVPRPAETLHLATPTKDQAWPAEFSQKVTWMATQDKQSAQITLNPPQMGPIEISLSIKNEQATAVFVAHNAEVRELLESALPRLREALADAGVTLGQADVSAESFQQARDGQGNSSRGNQARGETGSAIGSQGVAEVATRRGNGLVDTFA